MNEEWRQFRSTCYSVSNLGRVRNDATGKEKKATNSGNGYMIVGLFDKQKRTNILVHRAVAECFISEIVKPLEVNHKDGNKGNNTLSNLEIVTRSQNSVHAYKNGLNKLPTRRATGSAHWTRKYPTLVKRGKENGAALHPERIKRGSQCTHSKLNEESVRHIRELIKAGCSDVSIGEHYDVSYKTIYFIRKGKTWKHTLKS